MKKIGIILAALAVVGCTETSPIWDKDGVRHEAVACLDNQLFGGMTSCLKKAAKACPNGYYMQGSTNHPVGWQMTEPTEERYHPNDNLPNWAPNIVRFSNLNRAPGGYGWKPRMTKNRGAFQYITVKCK